MDVEMLHRLESFDTKSHQKGKLFDFSIMTVSGLDARTGEYHVCAVQEDVTLWGSIHGALHL